MFDYIDKFLDDLSYWSLRGLIAIGVIFWIGMAIMVVHSLVTKDPVVGETYHGIIIRESDLETEDE
jgi:hypothetical protein